MPYFSLFRRWPAVGMVLLALGACQRPSPAGVAATPAAPAATYTNPVWPLDFPDPTILRAADGYYYAYGTQGQWQGKALNLQVTRSADLVHWQHLGDRAAREAHLG